MPPQAHHELEPTVRIELTTPSLPWKCSTPELRRQMVIFKKDEDHRCDSFLLERKTRLEPATLSLEG
jgi:hypothetical protein